MVRFEKSLGREMDIASVYRNWDQPFPAGSEAAALDSNRYLMLSWDGGDTRAIVSGSQDTLIRQRARAVKAIGKPVFLRWQHEMDHRDDKEIDSPAGYIAAWKHIREIFQQELADNVAWVWCPSAEGFASADAATYYPGDDQVDWLCADAYPQLPSQYVQLAQVIKPFLGWARDRPKPIMIGEFGVPRGYGTRRAEWLREAARTLQDPQIKAVVYHNEDVLVGGATIKYSLDGDQPAMSAMRELATTPYFNSRNLPVSSG
jgi:beta-mannanase